MVWIFASVVLILLVLVPGFRRGAGRAILVGLALCVAGGVGYAGYEWYREQFAPKITIEGVSYRVGSEEARWAGAYEEQHRRLSAEKVAEQMALRQQAILDERASIERKNLEFAQGAALANAEPVPVIAFQRALEVIYRRFPFLSKDSTDHNDAAINEALSITKTWTDKGMPASNAVLIGAQQAGMKYEKRTWD